MTIEINNEIVTVLPCPFCGDQPKIQKYLGRTGQFPAPPGIALKCEYCEAQTRITSNKTNDKYDPIASVIEAINMWNMRI